MSHMKSFGCEKCGYIKTGEAKSSNVDEFRSRGKAIHKDKYDYALVEYKGKDTPVKIICPDHGVFFYRLQIITLRKVVPKDAPSV